MAGVRLLASQRSVTFDDLKDALAKERRDRLRSRLQVFGTSHLRIERNNEEERYVSMTQQFVRLLKYSGFLSVGDGIISCTEKCQEIASRFAVNQSGAEAYFLGEVVNSRYTTYWRFLERLKAAKEIVIPKHYSARNDALGRYLDQIGFPLSVVSFFVLRDFYYDFGLLNYFITTIEERISPVYSFDPLEGELYNLHFKSPQGKVFYSKKVGQEEFERVIARIYFSMSGGREVVVDMMQLRENVCADLKISELDFNYQFGRVMEKPGTIQVSPSIGDLYYQKRTGSLTKVLTLPKSESGYPFTLLRLTRTDS